MSRSTGDVYHARHVRADNRSLVEIIATKVADATETPVEELPPLYHAIPPDALKLILRPESTAPTERPTTVTFEYFGQTVSVDSEGNITIADRKR